MAKSALKWKDRRAMLDSSRISPEALGAAGRELLGAGFLAESAELFRKAKDLEGLAALKARAVEEGDFFLYGLARQYLGEEPLAQDLAALAERAAAAGLESSRRKAGELLAKIQSPGPGQAAGADGGDGGDGEGR
jgi:hypothetical protein